MGRVLGHQLAAVRAVQRLVAEPARQEPVPLEVRPGRRGHPGANSPIWAAVESPYPRSRHTSTQVRP